MADEQASCKEFTAEINQKNEAVAKKIYRRLRDTQIRYVKIHSGVGRMRCTLIQTSNFTKKYSALSYVWGSQDKPKIIYLNGKKFRVSRNLHEALVKLRRPSRHRYVWIDALAINQSNLSERSVQVRKMASIYSSAKNTLIWLGEVHYSGRDWLLRSDDNRIKITKSYCPIENIFEILSDESYSFSSLDAELLPRKLASFGHSLDSLLSLPYWERVWVVQEMMHSGNASLLFGSHVIPFRRLRKFYDRVKELLSVLGCSPDTTNRLQISRVYMNDTLDIRKYGPGSASSGNLISVNEWLDSFCPKSKCSDPRDKVFGFYSCFVPELRSQIVVDYTKSTVQVFSEMVEAVIRLTSHLDIINDIDRYSRETTETKKLPSWIPNFAGDGKHLYSFPTSSRVDTSNKVPAPFYKISKGGTVLHIKGLCIGNVTQISDILEFQRGEIGQARVAIKNHFGRCDGQLDVDKKDFYNFLSTFLGPKVSEKMSTGFLHMLETPGLASRGPHLEPLDPDDLDFEDSRDLLHLHCSRPMFIFKSAFATKTGGRKKKRWEFLEHVAIGSPNMVVGDKVYAIPCCTYPVIIRQVNGKHKLVGTAFTSPYAKEEPLVDKHRHLMNCDLLESLYLH
jgi:Heterokaryon incompatibility protein (HET)